VFANEIDGDVKSLPAGASVDVASPEGAFLGRGYSNPRALIAVRIVSWNKAQNIDLPGFFAARIRQAVELREMLWPGRTACRIVDGDADGLPGLVIDRYGDLVVAQFETLGMQERSDVIRTALQDVLPATAGLLRNDLWARRREGLEEEIVPWFGDVPEVVNIDEFGVAFGVRPAEGEVTGHLFAHSENRRLFGGLCRDRTVLDVYSGSGGFGLHALLGGARHVTFVDKAKARCEQIDGNVALNGFDADRVTIVKGEGRRTMMALLPQGRRYGCVVIDPPPFARVKKNASAGMRGYREVNSMAMQLVSPGGYFVTGTHSQFALEERFLSDIQLAAHTAGLHVKMIYRGQQSADHPVLPGVPEARLLKHYVFHVLPEA
jgi:23S rRNA (cytosine1962-C5)-methyltransferase